MNRINNLVFLLAMVSAPCGHVSAVSDTAANDHVHRHHFHGHCNCAECNQKHEAHGYRIGDYDENHVEPFRVRGNGWTTTASGTSGPGAPAILTWSVVPDGTQLPTSLGEPVSPNNLIAFLDGVHHGGTSPGGGDLTQRDWWHLMNSAFERWDELSGLSFHYEPADDGRRLGSFNGALGVRGDHRIGGHSIDGQTSPTFLAYNFFPNNSDMVIDTDEINRWSNSSNDYRLFRNMLMHEIGHGVGLNHVESVDVDPDKPEFQFGTFLMEPTLASVFDGPQLDDILGAHRLYGDFYEKGAGNDHYSIATHLGTLRHSQPLAIGTDAEDTLVDPQDTDFVSIDDNSDTDFFRFTIHQPKTIDLLLTPMGPTYMEGGQGSGNGGTQVPLPSAELSNLTLTLFDSNGTSVLEFANNTPRGFSEQIVGAELASPGDYFVRVAGLDNNVQLFRLDITAVPEPSSLWLLMLSVAQCVTVRRRKRKGGRIEERRLRVISKPEASAPRSSHETI